jgi:hypothetical protein
VNRIIYNKAGFFINFAELREKFGLVVYYNADKGEYNINHMKINRCPPTIADCIVDYNSKLTINLLRYIFNLAKENIDAARAAASDAAYAAYAAADAARAAAADAAYAARAAAVAARAARAATAYAAAYATRAAAADAAYAAADAARAAAADAAYATRAADAYAAYAEKMDIAIQKLEEYIKIVEAERK